MKRRTLALLCAVVMVVGMAIGGTLAWLVADSGPVTNTFTVGDVNISLTEPNAPEGNKYDLVPGNVMLKDPTVTVEEGSEPCWVFVEMTVADSLIAESPKLLEYGVRTGWELVETAPNTNDHTTTYVYRWNAVVNATTADQTLYVLACQDTTNEEHANCHGCVSVPSGVTKQQLEALGENAQLPMTFQAYAIQSANLNTQVASEIWDLVTDET